jgi:TP901 family phage tail tape measure protein
MGTALQTVGAAMAGIGGAITAGLASAANSFADFDAKLKDIQTSTGATSEEVEMMSKKITQLGDGATSIEQITQGFSALAANGASLQEMNVIMESATQLMSGFGASAETASGILQTAVRAYGVSLEQLETTTDQLAEASKSIDMSVLADQLQKVGPAASAAGVSLGETVAGLLSLKEKGANTEQAVQGLRKLFTELSAPSEALKTTLEGLGVSLEDLSNPALTLTDKIKLLRDSGLDAEKALKAFGTEAGASVALLLEDGGDAIDGYIEKLENSGGAAKDAANRMEGSLKGAITSLKNSFTSLKNSIGASVAPLFTGIANAVKGLVQWFDKLPAPIKGVVTQFGAIAGMGATLVGALSAIAGTIIKSIDNFKKFGDIMKNLFTTDLPRLATGIKEVGTKILELGSVAGKNIFSALKAGAAAVTTEIKKTAQEFSGFQGALKAGIAVGAFAAMAAALGPVIEAVKKAREEVEALKESIADISGVNIEMSDLEKFTANIASLGGLIPGVKESLETMFIANKVTDYNNAISTNLDLMEQLARAWSDYKNGKLTVEEFTAVHADLNKKIEEVVKSAGGIKPAFGSAADGVTELRDSIDKQMSDAANIAEGKAKDAASSIENAFKNIDVRPDLLPESVVNSFKSRLGELNFKTIEESARNASEKINTFFDVLGKEVAAKLGVIDGYEFSTIPGKAAQAAKDVLSAFVDVGVDAKSALDIINTIDFKGLAVSVDDAKKRITDSLLAVGYSATEAEKFVNAIDFDTLKKNAAGAKDDIADAFTSAKNKALQELEEIDNKKFDMLRSNLSKAITGAVEEANINIKDMSDKLDKLNGKKIAVTFDFAEAGA